MKNAMYYIDKAKYTLFREQFEKKNWFIVELQGTQIQSVESFLHEVWEKFKFPQTGFINYDAYLDWIRDLDWLNQDGYIMAIFDFGKSFIKNPELKKEIIEDFSEVVLPWWQGEVEKCVVNGRSKPFNIYFVD